MKEGWRKGEGNPSILLCLIFLQFCCCHIELLLLLFVCLKFNCDNPLVCWYDMADLLDAATVFGLAISELEARLWTVLLQKGQLFGIDGTTTFPINR